MARENAQVVSFSEMPISAIIGRVRTLQAYTLPMDMWMPIADRAISQRFLTVAPILSPNNREPSQTKTAQARNPCPDGRPLKTSRCTWSIPLIRQHKEAYSSILSIAYHKNPIRSTGTFHETTQFFPLCFAV